MQPLPKTTFNSSRTLKKKRFLYYTMKCTKPGQQKKKITELLLQAKEDSPAFLPLVPVPVALHSW